MMTDLPEYKVLTPYPGDTVYAQPVIAVREYPLTISGVRLLLYHGRAVDGALRFRVCLHCVSKFTSHTHPRNGTAPPVNCNGNGILCNALTYAEAQDMLRAVLNAFADVLTGPVQEDAETLWGRVYIDLAPKQAGLRRAAQ